MSPVETNVLLAFVQTLDGRFRETPQERAERARAWSEVLDPALSVRGARAGVVAHYAGETRMIMPADLNAVVEPVRSSSDAGDVTAARLEREARALTAGDVAVTA